MFRVSNGFNVDAFRLLIGFPPYADTESLEQHYQVRSSAKPLAQTWFLLVE